MNRRIAKIITRTCAFILAVCFVTWAENNYIYDVVIFIGFWGILAAGELALKYFDQYAKQKAKKRIPYLREIYKEQIKNCQHAYFELIQTKSTYTEDVTMLGLNHWHQQTVTEECRQKPLKAVLKYTQVAKDPHRFKRLQNCINYIQKKEQLGHSLGTLAVALTNDLSKRELEFASALDWACEVAGISQEYIKTHYFNMADPEDYSKDVMWALTSRNLTLLLEELQRQENQYDNKTSITKN